LKLDLTPTRVEHCLFCVCVCACVREFTE